MIIANQTITKKNKFDVVIIGAGFAGLMTAITLAPLKLRILLIDKNPPPNKSNDPRAIALNYASQQLLTRHHVWPLIASEINAINCVHISEKGRFNKVRFYAAEQGVEALGYVVNGQKLLEALHITSNSHANITCLYQADIDALNHEERLISINHKNKITPYYYQLLIACDGSQSKTREQLGIDIRNENGEQQALLRCIQLQQSHQQTAFERFTEKGIIALLPIAQQQCKLVITGNKQQIALWQSYDEKIFLQQLQQQFGYFIGKFSAASSAVCYPLQHLTAERQVIAGAILLGNAAHTFSPLAAQGLNLTLGDINYLSETISDAIARQQDFASLDILHHYIKLRQHNQQLIQQFTQKLGTIFTSRNPFVRCGRQFALAACQLSPLLHYGLAKKLLGQ